MEPSADAEPSSNVEPSSNTEPAANVAAKVPAYHHFRQVVWHLADMMVTTLRLLKVPLACFMAFYVTASLLTGTITITMDTIQTQITPRVCCIPLISSSAFCGAVQHQRSEGPSSLQRADFPSLVRVQDVVLNNLLEKSGGGSALAVNVKHTELAVKDLVAVVRASNLTIKFVLADTLGNFAADAHSAGRGLHRLSTKMHVAVDSITSLNTYALRTINAAKEQCSTAIVSIVRHTFETSIDGLSSQLTRVIVEATMTTVTLDRLEDRLFEIQNLCIPEALLTNVELHDLLWAIWTILGSNKEKLRDLRHCGAVLKEVEQYRAVALAYVSDTAHILQGLEAELAGLQN